MINLKKNDKLIIIIAVAVVIVAGIGIAAYNPPEGGNGNTGIPGGAGTYGVTWQTHTKTVSVDEELYAGKSSPFSAEIPIDHENIVKVTVEITWTDDNTYGILTTKGQDTLTAEVICKGKTETQESIGNGTIEFNFNINSIPFTTEIEADNEVDAKEKLKEDYTDDPIALTIDINVATGEKLRRPLKYFKDKGNDFGLTITYEYYEASLTEGNINDTGGDVDNPPEDDDAFSRLGNLVNTGSCVRW